MTVLVSSPEFLDGVATKACAVPNSDSRRFSLEAELGVRKAGRNARKRREMAIAVLKWGSFFGPDQKIDQGR
jgi:hypothetical protein